jgi:hypothetical protein
VETPIKNALEGFDVFDTIEVGSTENANQGCSWDVTFTSSIGNLALLEVQAYNYVTKSTGTYGSSSSASDDLVKVEVSKEGTDDVIKAALEGLSTVGTVTVTAVDLDDDASNGVDSPDDRLGCTWKVTFDTNAGDSLTEKLQMRLYDTALAVGSESTWDGDNDNTVLTDSSGSDVITATISQDQASTSEVIGGTFALEFRGARTEYMSYDVAEATLKTKLEALDTIGEVTVSRSSGDENNGYSWSVTFNTELGDVDTILFDSASMTGTAVTGTVTEDVVGVMPQFNSLDQDSGLPLGSIVVADLTTLSATATSLDEGIAYYFRVAAINSIGQGPFAYFVIFYVIL